MRYALIIENNPGKRYVSTPVEISPNNRFKTENAILGGKNPAEKSLFKVGQIGPKNNAVGWLLFIVKEKRELINMGRIRLTLKMLDADSLQYIYSWVPQPYTILPKHQAHPKTQTYVQPLDSSERSLK